MKHILLYQLKDMEKKHSISSVKDIWLGYGICICITSYLYKPKIHPVNEMVKKADADMRSMIFEISSKNYRALNEHLD